LIGESCWLIVTTEEWDMRQTTGIRKSPGEKLVKDIKRAKTDTFNAVRLGCRINLPNQNTFGTAFLMRCGAKL
jgi:hypothetical protein